MTLSAPISLKLLTAGLAALALLELPGKETRDSDTPDPPAISQPMAADPCAHPDAPCDNSPVVIPIAEIEDQNGDRRDRLYRRIRGHYPEIDRTSALQAAEIAAKIASAENLLSEDQILTLRLDEDGNYTVEIGIKITIGAALN